MRDLHYRQALEKFPEIRTRRHRRAAWREGRRASFCTHAAEDPGKGTHAQRRAMWYVLWPKMSVMAEDMREKRKRELKTARILDRTAK